MTTQPTPTPPTEEDLDTARLVVSCCLEHGEAAWGEAAQLIAEHVQREVAKATEELARWHVNDIAVNLEVTEENAALRTQLAVTREALEKAVRFFGAGLEAANFTDPEDLRIADAVKAQLNSMRSALAASAETSTTK